MQQNTYAALLVIILPALAACGSGNGPCDYDIQKFKAEVTEFRPYAENEYTKEERLAGKKYFHIVMEFDRSTLSEREQYLDELKGISFDTTLIKLNKLRAGNIYTGLVSEVVSGNCTPLIISFDQQFRPE